MPYVQLVSLRPIITTNNGSESIAFLQTLSTFKEEDVNFATGYYNPVTGLFDINKSTLYFESGETLVINQTYAITSAQLIALN
tara:strand:- start:186 stop:434 length:249 start_codon:yes stop_codon:yes gene_type:complete